jgi:hypothetical protein
MADEKARGSSLWVWRGGIFWMRVFGWGFYRIRGERPYLLRPGKPPKRNLGLIP